MVFVHMYESFLVFSFKNLVDTEPKRWTNNHMCVQDTFEHKRNVTHKIIGSHVKAFKDFCGKSLAVIQEIGPSVKYWNINISTVSTFSNFYFMPYVHKRLHNIIKCLFFLINRVIAKRINLMKFLIIFVVLFRADQLRIVAYKVWHWLVSSVYQLSAMIMLLARTMCGKCLAYCQFGRWSLQFRYPGMIK